MVKGNVLQLNLHDGSNVLSKEGYPTSSTLVMKVPEMKVVTHLSLKKDTWLVIKGKTFQG